MKLTQGILPSSKVKDGVDTTIATNPSNHGGIELGTWTDFLADFPMSMNVRPVCECQRGVQCCHQFTKKECEEVLLTLSKSEIKKKYLLKVRKILKSIFESDDLPVYYWAN